MQRFQIHRSPSVLMPSRRGDAAKVIIITVCAFAMIMLMLCVGAGFYGYVLFQRNLGRAVVQAPADIRKLTTEITDIDIPPQFTPLMGSAIFGMKSVNYTWNPQGKPANLANPGQTYDPLQPMLHIMEMATGSADMKDEDFKINPYQQKALKSQYVDFTQNVQEFTIRGRKCQFLFVTGQPREGAFDDEAVYDEIAEEEMLADENTTTPAAAENKPADATAIPETPATPSADATAEVPQPVDPAAKVLPSVRTVTGQFPGKSGSTTITIRVPVEGSDEDVLLKIIQSLH